MTTEVIWPASLTADSTFSDEIGAISDVEYSPFSDSFADAFNKAIDKLLDTNTIISFDPAGGALVHAAADKLRNAIPLIIKGFENKYDLKDYIINQAFINISISYKSSTEVGISVDINNTNLIHKEDFVNICNILNNCSSEIVTRSTPIYATKPDNIIYIFDTYNVSSDSKYTLLHNYYSFNNLSLTFDYFNCTSESIAESIVNNTNSLKVWENYIGRPFNAHGYMINIFKGMLCDNYEQYSGSYVFGGGVKFGTYGSSTKTSGQPESGESGGDGDGDNESDNIDVPPLPALGAVNSGIVTLFNPVLMEIKELASYLWDHDIWTQLNKMFQKPMDAVISLNLCNIKPQIAGEKQGVFVGGFNTNVQMSLVTKQYVEVDCGSIDIKKYWGNFMDYNPHTKIELYLPFIGFTNIDTDNVMGKKLAVKYYVDLLTGTCQCYVSVIAGDYNAILYTYTGNCFTQIPISSGNYDAMKQTLMFAIGGVAIGAVTAGTGAVASSMGGITSVSGLQTAAGTSITSGIASKAVAGASKGGLKGCAVSSVMGSKSGIHRSGNASSASALMNYKKPYLIITRPSQSLPVDYNKFNGYPSNITSKLSDLKGYTEVETVHVEGFNCTDDEKDMIEGLLKNGVFL